MIYYTKKEESVMLPHFHEWEKEAIETYAMRLKPLNMDKKNILEVDAEYLEKFFKHSYTTNANIKSALVSYIEWLKSHYDDDVKEIIYTLHCITANDNYNPEVFTNLQEMLNEMDMLEEQIMGKIQNVPTTDDANKNPLRTMKVNLLRLKGIYILLWYGLQYADMTTIYRDNISDGSIFVPSWNKEIQLDENSNCIIQRIKNTDMSWIDGTDNFLKSDKEKTLRNLTFLTIGRVEDKRFYKNNIQKAGYFYRFDQWERQNNKVLTAADADIVMELTAGLIARSQVTVKLAEYKKYITNI